jgi:2-keto-4-pentenoate hydratase/2-oxohepta-3-ene-1,7-dioic acid hydratase in catechol pathway
MRLASGRLDGREQLWWVTEQGLLRVGYVAALRGEENTEWTMERFLTDLDNALDLLQSWWHWAQESEVMTDRLPDETLAPVTQPGKILCVGLNYRPHARESHMEIPQYPVLFNKYSNAVVGSGRPVHPPAIAQQMDYEAELVVIMGRRAVNVAESDALRYVAGYCNGNDLSARDLQFRTSQWLLGKAADGFGPMGPYLVTPDEIPDPNQLEIVCRRNGVEVQHSNTRHMIFSCSHLISYISRYMTLEPGDVIFTGTPEGVIFGQQESERQWLKAGETVSVSIEGLGELTTPIGNWKE